jgi:hypothetical protein
MRDLVRVGRGAEVAALVEASVADGTAPPGERYVEGLGSLARLHCVAPVGRGVAEEECEGFMVEVEGERFEGVALDAEAAEWAKVSADDLSLHGLASQGAGYFFLHAPHHDRLCQDVGEPGMEEEGGEGPRGTVTCSLGGRRMLFRTRHHFRAHVHEHLRDARQRRLSPFSNGQRTLGNPTQLIAVVKFSDLGYNNLAAGKKWSNETVDGFAQRICRQDHESSFSAWKRSSYGQSDKVRTYVPGVLTMRDVTAASKPVAASIYTAAINAIIAAGYSTDSSNYFYICT